MAFHHNHQKKPDILYRSSETVKNRNQFQKNIPAETKKHYNPENNPSSSAEKETGN